MEALWNFEDKWKLSTQQAFVLLTCTAAAAVLAICAAAKWWSAAERRSQETTPFRLLGGSSEEEGRELGELELGSRNSTAAMWQRPILMGEKCEMLKYSGLILYDQTGRLLQHQIAAMEIAQKEGEAKVVKTMLKDLL